MLIKLIEKYVKIAKKMILDSKIKSNQKAKQKALNKLKIIFLEDLQNEDTAKKIQIRKYLIDREKETGDKTYSDLRDELTNAGINHIKLNFEDNDEIDSWFDEAENERQNNIASEDKWVQVIFDWADRFNIDNINIPRDKKSLMKLKKCNIGTPSYVIHEYYDKDGIQMDYIPDEFTNLKNLKLLNLKNCNLSELPENIGNLKSLKTIDISCNKLTYLPETLGNIKSLKNLYFAKNYDLKYILGSDKWINLESIDAHQSGLDELPITLVFSKKLKYLNLSHTKLGLQQDQKDWLYSLKDKGCEVVLDSTEIMLINDDE